MVADPYQQGELRSFTAERSGWRRAPGDEDDTPAHYGAGHGEIPAQHGVG